MTKLENNMSYTFSIISLQQEKIPKRLSGVRRRQEIEKRLTTTKCERRDIGGKKLPDCNDAGVFLQQPGSPSHVRSNIAERDVGGKKLPDCNDTGEF